MTSHPFRSAAAHISLLTLLAGCTPTIYARRDYDQYPAHKKEIALFNMREIARDMCAPLGSSGRVKRCLEMQIDGREIRQKTGFCRQEYFYNDQYGSHVRCDEVGERQETIYLSSVRKLVPQGDGGKYEVKVCGEGGDCKEIKGFKDLKQAEDFAEALRVYLQE